MNHESCKLKVVGLPGKVIRAIWPIVRDNFVQITTAECLSNSVTQNVGLAQGECLSPLLYSIFTHDVPAVVEGQGGVKTLLYADDLAICLYLFTFSHLMVRTPRGVLTMV